MPAPIGLEEARERSWDVIVVGTGMGGGTIGYALSKKKLRVLFVEKGLFLFGDHDRGWGVPTGGATDPNERLREGWWPEQIAGATNFQSEIKAYLPVGCGTGGGSSLYAAQLERMLPSDFEPRKYHPDAKDSTVPEAWPFAYEELLPYYREAERLFRVCGTPDPLNPDPAAQLAEPPAMSDRDAYIYESFDRLELSPYRAHVGCRYVPGCTGCGASLCARGCKSDSGLVALLPAMEQHDAALLPQAEVSHLEADASRVTGVVVEHKGVTATLRAERVVLAAGALMTPKLLLQSKSDAWPNGLANRSDMVGRNLMMHAGDHFAIRPSKALDPAGPGKSISSNHFYVREGKKLGNLQSVGLPVYPLSIAAFLRQKTEKERTWYLRWLGERGRGYAAQIGYVLFNRANVFATIVEDLPYLCNRVVLDGSEPSGMRFEYTWPDELQDRSQLLRRAIKKALRKDFMLLTLDGYHRLNFGHLSGTVRSGEDAASSVLDANNRAHDVENLYVADASTFPSSGGVNPSLTIAANALRVADAMAG